MDVVIRDAKTVEEYKNRRADMERQAKRYYNAHRAACEDWRDGSFVVEYTSGRWWHYRDTNNGVEWY